MRTEAQIDTSSRMVHVIARVSNEEQDVPLNVGLFVNAEIEGLLVEDVVVLPRNALRNGNRVLVVDDEKNIRRTLRMVLEGEGYQVVDAPSAEKALELLPGVEIESWSRSIP